MKKLIVVLLLTAMLSNFGGVAYARDHHRGGGGVGWGLGGLVAGTLLGAAIASSQQPVYETVYVSGTQYYRYNGRYHQRDAYGNYYVVQQPVVYVQPEPVVVQQPVYIQQAPVQQPAVQQAVVQEPAAQTQEKTVKVNDIVLIVMLLIIIALMIGIVTVVASANRTKAEERIKKTL